MNSTNLPKNGDTFNCTICGFALLVTQDCKCVQPGDMLVRTYLKCCGQAMVWTKCEHSDKSQTESIQ